MADRTLVIASGLAVALASAPPLAQTKAAGITRGLPEVTLPAPYSSNLQIVTS